MCIAPQYSHVKGYDYVFLGYVYIGRFVCETVNYFHLNYNKSPANCKKNGAQSVAVFH